MERSETDVKITRLDLESLKEKILDNKDFEGKNEPIEEISIADEPWGVVGTSDGIFAVSEEGVGPENPIDDDNPLVLKYRAVEKTDDGKKKFSPIPDGGVKIYEDDIYEMATGETLTLDEHIRDFGNRLDSNYEEWRKTLEPIAE